MTVKEISVKKNLTMPDGQTLEITVSGCTPETGIDTETAKYALQNILNSGILALLKNEILRPIEEKYAQPMRKRALQAV